MSVRFGGNVDTYQTLLSLEERLGLGLFVWNADTDELQWSDGMFALLGLKPGSLQPTMALLLSMTYPDDRVSSGWLRHELKEGRLLDRDFRVVLRDGRVRHINRRSWLAQSEGNNKQVAGVCIDVTALFEARAKSDLIQQRFKGLINAATCAVWTAAPNSHSLQPISLLSAEKLHLQDNWLDRVPAEDHAALQAAWFDAVTRREPFASLHRIAQTAESFRWCESHAVPLMDEGHAIVEWIGVTIDVHDLVAGGEAPRQITGAQIRGGRGILNWSVRDLADKAGITIGIVRRLEEFDGTPHGYDDALSVVLRAMNNAGVEFFLPPGGKPAVRPR